MTDPEKVVRSQEMLRELLMLRVVSDLPEAGVDRVDAIIDTLSSDEELARAASVTSKL